MMNLNINTVRQWQDSNPRETDISSYLEYLQIGSHPEEIENDYNGDDECKGLCESCTNICK